MRVMVIVKASKSSEAGVMPSERLINEMSRFNGELAEAGVMLAGEGAAPELEGRQDSVFGLGSHPDQWPVRRDQ